jgi:hypothetical protein
MPTKSLLQTRSMTDVKASVSVTLEDVDYVCHMPIYKGPVHWTGPLIWRERRGSNSRPSRVTPGTF